MAAAFQRTAFQNNAFQTGLDITDTHVIQLPINCILLDQQDYEVGHSEIEARNPNIRTRITVSHGDGGRLSSNESSFRTITDKKGYD